MRKLLSLSVLAASLVVSPAHGFAQTVIDFEELGTSPTVRTWSSYSFGDFMLSTSGSTFGAWGTESENYPGSVALFNNQQGEWTTLSTLSGSPFDIFSISLAHLFYVARPAGPVTFTGTFMDGATLFQTFLIPASAGGSPVLHDFAFEAGFRNLQSLSWQQTLPTFQQFDNIVVASPGTTVIPEPISMVLLGTGLAGVAAARRRKRNREDAAE